MPQADVVPSENLVWEAREGGTITATSAVSIYLRVPAALPNKLQTRVLYLAGSAHFPRWPNAESPHAQVGLSIESCAQIVAGALVGWLPKCDL